jgi:hypothetical protein
MLFLGMVRVAPAAGGLDVPAFIDAIAESERRLLNVHVRSELWQEERKPDSEEWKKTGVFLSTTSWRDGLAGSRARIDIDREVLVWTNGKAPYSEDKLSLGYDGRYGRVAYHESGPAGNTVHMARAEVLPTRPEGLDDPMRQYATGAGFSCFYFFNRHGKMFSEVCREMLERHEELAVAEAEIGGRKCLRFLVGELDATHEAFWVDPSRGYALLKHEMVNVRRDGDRWSPRTEEVLELEEASEGVWYPTKGVVEMRRPDPRAPRFRYVYQAEDVVANAPGFDPQVFTVPFPDGYSIDDQVRGLAYETGMSPRELESRIDSIVEAVSVGFSPAALPAAEQNEQESDSDDARQSGPTVDPGAHDSGRSVIGLVAPCVAAMAVLVGLIFYARRRRKGRESASSIGGLLAILFVFGPGLVGRAPAGPVGAWGYHYNCGLNVGYFCLRHFGVRVGLLEVASDLGAGDRFENTVSMYVLRTVLLEYGLRAEAYKVDTFPEALPLVSQGDILLLRLRLGDETGDDRWHFVALVPGSEGYVLVDPPGDPQTFSMDGLLGSQIPNHATGELLAISSRRPDAATMKLEIGEAGVHAIPSGGYKLTAVIKYRNVGTERLKIETVKASCGCVMGMSGDRELDPGKSGSFTVLFDQRKLPRAKEVVRGVTFFTNDPEHSSVEVDIVVPGNTPGGEEAPWVEPPSVDLGRQRVEALASQTVGLVVTIPVEEDCEGMKCGVVCPEGIYLRETSTGQSELISASGKHLVTKGYEIFWGAEPPTGLFSSTLEFRISGCSDATQIVRLPVRVDVIP